MKSKSLLRRHLALTTILTVAPFFGYGRQAYAACDPVAPGSSTITCGGANAATVTIINVDNADVSTAPGFSVDAAGDGVHINGFGHIQFTDANGSAITAGAGGGIVAYSQGGAGANPAAITISTNGNVTGGSNGIKAMNYGGGDITITADGQVEAANGTGIYAYNAGNEGALTVTTGAASTVTGSRDGIDVRNFGTGDTEITANGKVTGTNGAGITTFNLPEGGNIVINTGAGSEVAGGQRGINAQNFGTDSDLVIGIGGKVSGREAVVAANSVFSRGLTITQREGSVIEGEEAGILATNFGGGDLVITADGELAGTDGEGINAQNSGRTLTITTGGGSEITGFENGIYARNLGSGDLEILANGKVTGTGTGYDFAASGIYALNGSNGVNLTVITGAGSEIDGVEHGIYAKNEGSGDLLITAAGSVTAQGGTGVHAVNSADGNDLTIVTAAGSKVIGKTDAYGNSGDGIHAYNYGRGSLDIIVNGDVTSEYLHGIHAFNYSGSGDLKITIGARSTVRADYNGIDAENIGSGNLDIAVDGTVISEAGLAGIVAFNWSESGGDLTIATGTESAIISQNRGIMARQFGQGDLEIVIRGEVTGRETGSGIYSDNIGGGETRIFVGTTGLVQGYTAGIEAASGDDQAISITNYGTVRNLDGMTNSRAIDIGRGPTTIVNNGLILGKIEFDEEFGSGDTVNNNGTWNFARGVSTFGSGDDRLNNRGILIAAEDAEHREKTLIDMLEAFDNSGMIKLADGAVGDRLEIAGDVRFNGAGGMLVVDAELAEGGEADRLVINGTLAGVTRVSVKATGAIGANEDGIAVVEVNGDSSGGDIALDEGSRNMGFFAWDMRRNAGDSDLFELYSSGLGAGAYEFAGGLTAAQDVWFQSMGTLLQRQADLRAAITGTQVTPVADFSEPAAPTAAGRAMPGFWFKALGAYLERDAEENGVTLDRRQTVFGGLAGLDVGLDLEGPGETVLFGLFGGYLTSDLEFKATNSKWDYEGPSVGAYATYLNQAFYADLTVKADFLSIDIDADDLAPGAGEADTKGFNIGGQIDAGYKIGLEHGLFVEPQASLAVLHTEIDDIDDILGGAVEFDDETSVRGRLGARLGHEFTGGNALVYASDIIASVWQEFNGSNGATILAPDFAVAGVSDDTVGTFGDMSVGFAVTSPEGWSSFLRGSWQFAEDFDALSASAGLRYAW
ncbi:MAG: autotransporter outer membrane beta-barrel domain-containing protein [Pseudomonadota bacterium]